MRLINDFEGILRDTAVDTTPASIWVGIQTGRYVGTHACGTEQKQAHMEVSGQSDMQAEWKYTYW